MNRILIIGNSGGTNLGESFYHGSEDCGYATEMVLASQANHKSKILNKIRWVFFDKVPAKQNEFEKSIEKVAENFNPTCIIVAGCIYLSKKILEIFKSSDTATAIYLTDDPWNRSGKSRKFITSLSSYDFIFNPRMLNMKEVMRINPATFYLPFAYCPHLLNKGEIRQQYKVKLQEQHDVFFYGGADTDRVEIIEGIQAAGFKVLVAGNYWKALYKNKGISVIPVNLNPTEIQIATNCSSISLCMVRKANRDGHSMRSYELPYFGACILAEDTQEHRKIFGNDGESVIYYSSQDNLLLQIKKILKSEQLQKVMRKKAHNLIISNQNTYADRVSEMVARIKG